MPKRAAATLAALIACSACASAAQDRWQPLASSREGQLLYDPASVVRTGDRVRFVGRVVPAEPGGWVAANADYEVDCAAQTSAMYRIEAFDAEGKTLRAVTIPRDRVRHEPMYAGREPDEPMYRRMCAGGKPLPPLPEPLPPPVATPPRP